MGFDVTPAEVALRLGLAIVLGGALGYEREFHDKPAGLRTHMMVALGAATFTLIAMELFARVTTAGSLWFVGSVGVAIGGGYYVTAGLAVAAGLLVLAGMGVAKRFLPRAHGPGGDRD